MTDARVLRTRASLHRAIAALAAKAPVTEITVSQLAEDAGINRATFYKHFDSPSETLASFLQAELGPVRDRFSADFSSPDVDPVDAYRNCVQGVLDHVERFRDVYAMAIATPHDGVAQNLLCDFFTDTVHPFLESRSKVDPRVLELEPNTAARFFAHGIVGAIKSWVLNGDPDREYFVRTLVGCAPDWWLRPRTT
ncbi:TetR/AcrR family transcriptional regulator [Leucobacter sp. CSA1]|uniref:TetR/AcrR family transcriptional regulator n=1 Tax=Leucobacter chromiisoli TaxID=2796471 RepID=A0A934UU60_9MICO|nr:TetR/AcrR family transcriptional regulator [Leucobacter chromiisoli]MBK0417843.1 TetR/AcrR family transcriptional regulator [Leucobacter chromiisoli]